MIRIRIIFNLPVIIRVFSSGASLLKAVDPLKDQTVFLSQMSQEALQKVMFPVGHMNKSEVKQMALKLGFEEVVQKREVRLFPSNLIDMK